jgi:hypothetical protein
VESYVFGPYIIRIRYKVIIRKGWAIEEAGRHERLRLSLFAGMSSLLHYRYNVMIREAQLGKNK